MIINLPKIFAHSFRITVVTVAAVMLTACGPPSCEWVFNPNTCGQARQNNASNVDFEVDAAIAADTI